MKWSEIDVILTLPNHAEIKLWMTNSGADAAGALNHVKIISINKIFEGLMTNQLAAAYRASGFNPLARDDFLAKFKKCGPTGADVHYRLPGMTDFAVQAWFSLIATGLGTEEDNHRKKTVKTADYWA